MKLNIQFNGLVERMAPHSEVRALVAMVTHLKAVYELHKLKRIDAINNDAVVG